MSNYILGIHYGHDATLCLMENGKIVEVMSEERLSRQKKHHGFPHLSLEYIKNKYKIDSFAEVIAVGAVKGYNGLLFTTIEDNKKWREHPPQEKRFLRAIAFKSSSFGPLNSIRSILSKLKRHSILSKLKGSNDVEKRSHEFLEKTFPNTRITYLDHHLAHAYSSIAFMDDYNKKIILTLDGQGDDLSGSINIFDGKRIERKHRVEIKNSLGLFYCAFVDILGMRKNEHEFKVMGLAPYAKKSSGEKVYEKIKKVVWFDKNEMTIKSTINTDKGTSYLIANDFSHHRFDSLAYGIQKLTETIILDMAQASISKYNCRNIATAGGVFMNVKAVQYLSELPEVESLTVTPSAGDESLAIGACIYGHLEVLDHDIHSIEKINNLYLGSEYSTEELRVAIDQYPFTSECEVTYFDRSQGGSIEYKVASLLKDNHVVGRFSGRSEWGARALGNRSILANPSSRDNVKLINEMIKGRDFWMPFATSLLYERRHDYLDLQREFYAPFMSITFNTKPLAYKELQAALHPYDLTSRPQMVKKEINSKYYELIHDFQELTGIGGILNTSFNLHGEPNVETPYDAIRTFHLSGLKYLAIGDFLISKR